MTNPSGPKKKVGVDLDDVLLNLSPALCAYHNARHGTNLVRDDIKDYDLWNILECSKEEVYELVEAFYDSPEHLAALPVSGAHEALQALMERYEFAIVTAKPKRLRDMTQKWIDRHFPGIFTSIHFTGNYHLDPTMKPGKRAICEELGIGIFIDDALSNIHDLAPIMDRVFLLDSPWNRQEVPYDSVTRVFSWDDIREQLGEENTKREYTLAI